MTVTLTKSEVVQAAQMGMLRQVSALFAGRRDRHGYQDLKWETHIEGACAELAFAKAFGLYWSATVGRIDRPDFTNIEVKSTPYAKGHLIIRPDHDPESAYVLAIGRAPRFRLAGWLYGHEAQQQRFWGALQKESRAAYNVPQRDLHPIDTLPLYRLRPNLHRPRVA